MSFKHRAAGFLLLAALSGCALGIQQGRSPSDTFDVPVDYREAYRRADAQVRECLLGAGGYRAVGEMQPAAETARLEVRAPFSEDVLARVDIFALQPQTSRITVTMWGESIWNEDAIVAMRDAIRIGSASCKSYMPRVQGQRPAR